MIVKYLAVYVSLVFLCHELAAEENAQSHFIGAAGGDTLRLKVHEAVFLALQNNPTVTIQRLEPEIAKTAAAEARSDFDPVLSFSATRNETKLQRFLGSRPTPFQMTSERNEYDLALSEKLPTGTTLSTGVFMTGSVSSIYSDQYTGGMNITISQALLQGCGFGANLAALRRANLDVDISKAELKAVAENTIADVEQAYWDFYLAKKEVEIQRKSLEVTARQLQESQERVAVGKLPNLELAVVYAEVATRKEALIDAQSRHEQSRLHFIFLLNPSMPSGWATVPVLVDSLFVPLDSLAEIAVHEQLGMKYRPDLVQARLALQKEEFDIKQTKNGLLPKLDVFISLGRTSYANTFSSAKPDLKSPFYEINAGVTFDFPVLDRDARAKFSRAKKSTQQMELAMKNMERLVQWDIRSAHVEVLRSRQQIEATKVTRQLQDQKLVAEQEKFRVGKSTNFLVLQAQRDHIASQIDEARAMVAYLNALVNLYLVEGTLLERRGIQALNEG